MEMTKVKVRLEIHEGHWWALLDETEGVRTWAPIGSVESLREMTDVFGCAWLAYWYYKAGLLHKITGPIVRENDNGIVDILRMNKGKAV